MAAQSVVLPMSDLLCLYRLDPVMQTLRSHYASSSCGVAMYLGYILLSFQQCNCEQKWIMISDSSANIIGLRAIQRAEVLSSTDRSIGILLDLKGHMQNAEPVDTCHHLILILQQATLVTEVRYA